MKNITDLIRSRRSVRTFNGRELSPEDVKSIETYAKTIENPYGLPVEFRLMSAKDKGLVCPVVSGTDLYIGGKLKKDPHSSAAFGYSFEKLVLYAQSLGVGTTWLGGTMNRPAYEAAMELKADEAMPCASPLGYPAEKMTLKESMMRKAIKANERLPFEDLFFDSDFSVPLTKEKAGSFELPLEMVRLAPSAVNKQPWRAIVCGSAVHFYLKRSKGFTVSSLDMQMIDMGIALCHFDLTSQEIGLDIKFVIDDPKIASGDATEYIASYIVNK